MLLAAALLLTAGAWAQKTHTGYYLYHGKRVEVPVNSEVALAYFRTAKMDTATIHHRYQCLKEVTLAADKADTLYACEVRLPEGTYEEGVAWLKAQPEVWDVEPVIGTTERVPVSNMFFVKLRTADDAALLAEEAAKCGARHEGPVLPGDLWHALSVDKHSAGDALALSTQLGESGKFADVDPGFAYQVHFNVDCPDDTGFDNDQWNMQDMNLCSVWGDGIKGAGIKVAIIDNGVDISNPEFDNMTVAGARNASVPGANPATILGSSPSNTHATGLAGIIFSNHDSLYIAGMAPEASLVNVSFAAPAASYSDYLVAAAHRAFSYAVDTAHSDVILCAWDLQTWSVPSSILEADIVNAMENGRYGKGATVVFAAGNTANLDSNILYPANFDDRILVVGGIDRQHSWFNTSRFGSKLDVVAPGNSVPTTYYSQYMYHTMVFYSTSIAAAHAAGLAALILSANPNLTRHQVDRIIKGTAQKVGGYTYGYSSVQPVGSWNAKMGHGLLDATAAVEQATSTPAYDLWIKDDGMDDTGNEPNYDSYPVYESPSIHVFPLGYTSEVYNLNYDQTYTIQVAIHNLTSTPVYFLNSNVKFYWTVVSNKLWRNSWTSGGTTCGFANSGTVNATGTTTSISAGGYGIVTSATFTVPAYETPLCTLWDKPSSLSIVAVVDDDNLTVGENATDYPLEAFVRINNNVAWKSYSLGPTLPGYASPLNGDGNCISTLSPNPTTGQATLEYTLPEDVRVGEVLVMNSMGAVVYRAPATGQNHVIDLSSTPSGSYYVYLTGDGELLGMRTLIRD